MIVNKFKIVSQGNYYKIRQQTALSFIWRDITKPIERGGGGGIKYFPLLFNDTDSAISWLEENIISEIYIYPKTNTTLITQYISIPSRKKEDNQAI